MKKTNKSVLEIESNIRELFMLIPKLLDKSKIKTIFELGARDCQNTTILHNEYPRSNVYAFECNPDTLEECRNRIKLLKRAELIEKAVSNKNGKLTFYSIDQSKSDKTSWSDGNPGASSIFKISKKYPNEKLIQKKITISSIKLSTFLKKNNVKNIDLLFMDIQGAELLALRGLENSIKKVKIIHTEANFVAFYNKQALYGDIKKFLNNKGFFIYSVTNFTGPFADIVFVNSNYFNMQLIRIRELLLDILYAKVAYKVYSIAKEFKYYKTIMNTLRRVFKKI
ncbi:MAG: Methyltransferase FkbM family [Candidatus Nomurabacteria bacterium GW2011_GWB1_37_5]|uniref:Methyltransferase FkbM family n=1 Tax=Candidatus Nomurabacteria bacterium GW2011_GWB1_37_5 TaxID=1618742 RepID=A0A0G0GXN4_9BACT|nr:MAG: Methyltransferase FkbM family [Candidatus Nomurabacteria bacterium GW2011_GWB1_37_5]